MNLTRFLPGLANGEDELTEEELVEADAKSKAERIAWHRDNVRNGPRSFGHLTEGRHRSRASRGEKARLRKANKANRADWMRANRQLSTLRGQLEVVSRSELAGRPIYENALRGLFATYGPTIQEALEEQVEPGESAVKLDFHNHKHRTAVVQAAAHHYKLATGQVSA